MQQRQVSPHTVASSRDTFRLLVNYANRVLGEPPQGLSFEDIDADFIGDGAHVRWHGKGRKDRCIPLRRDSIAALRAWLKERGGKSNDRVFPNQRGRPLTHESLAYLLARNLAVARTACPSLGEKRVTPHTLRHSAAMEWLHNGVDRATIALWLGHESVETTYINLHADLKLKEREMAKTTPTESPMKRYQPEDRLLAFLNSL